MIKNSLELEQIFSKDSITLVDNVAKILTNKLIEIIDEEVYASYNPKFYKRTYEFKNSWEYTKPKFVDNIVQSEIFQNYATMKYVEKWTHGSKYSKPSGALLRNGLNEIINEGKVGIIANFPQLGKRPFWDKFTHYVENNIDNIFIQEARKIGLPLARGQVFTV